MATAADWATRVKDWEASGKTAQEFCAGRPFKAKNLVWWSSHFRRKGAAAPKKQGMSWARVVRGAAKPAGNPPSPTEPTDSDRTGRRTAQPIVIQIGGARIQLMPDGDQSALIAVFEALVRACEKPRS
jgi:transposase